MKTIACLGVASAVLLLLASCSNEESTRVLAPSPPPLSVRVTVSPYIITFGTSADVVVEVTNETAKKVSLDFDCGETVGFVLETEDGSFVLKDPSTCYEFPHTLVLKAHETQTFRRSLPPSLAPRLYLVSGGITEHEKDYPWGTARLTVEPR
jgi:hypothetical protein